MIAEEFEVVDIGPGFDDEDFAAVVELGEEGDAAGGSGGLGGDGGNECGGEGERRGAWLGRGAGGQVGDLALLHLARVQAFWSSPRSTAASGQAGGRPVML